MREPTTPLDAYLATQESQGRYFDSAGFTIDSLKAREKLSQYQLADSGLWLVKLVQCAVASGAPDITIRFERRRAFVSFTPKTSWQADDILAEVLSGHLPADDALWHLVTGLRAGVASVNESVAWSCGTAQVTLDSEGSRVTAQPSAAEFRLEATRPARSRALAHTLTSSVYHLAKQTVEEYDAVRSRCWVCPIAVTLDGQSLKTGYDLVERGHLERNPMRVLSKYQKGNQGMLQACLGVRYLHSETLGPECPRVMAATPAEDLQELQIRKPVYRHETFMTWPAESGKTCRGAIAVISRPRATSAVDFVLHGAVVQHSSLPLGTSPKPTFIGIPISKTPSVGVHIVVGVKREQLDLGQFAVRESEPEAVLEQVRPEVLELLSTLKDELGQLYYVPTDRPKAAFWGMGVGGQALFVTISSKGLALLPYAGALGVMVSLNIAIWRSTAKSGVKSLIDELSKQE